MLSRHDRDATCKTGDLGGTRADRAVSEARCRPKHLIKMRICKYAYRKYGAIMAGSFV